jgi:hypothetical protein
MIRPLLFVAVLLALPAAASAKDRELDPRAVYVVIDIEDLENPVVKGTHVPGAVTLGRYDPQAQDIRGGELSPGTALPGREAPRVTVDRRPVTKADGVRQYVVELVPDTWVIEGASGTAFSLGSVSFEIGPGEVIDLGVVRPRVDLVEGEEAMSVGDLALKALIPFSSMRPKNIRPVWLEWHARTASDLPLPAILGARGATPVTFVQGATFGNYLGGLVNRLGGRAERDRELAAAASPVAPAPTAEALSSPEVAPSAEGAAPSATGTAEREAP